jgi:uncharacterized protein
LKFSTKTAAGIFCEKIEFVKKLLTNRIIFVLMSKSATPARHRIVETNQQGHPMTTFPITSLYILPLTLIFLALWFNVTSTRSKLSQSIGDGGNIDLHERIRKHGNFVEWVPMVLLLMLLAEARGTGATWLHAAGALLTLGRALHPFGLKANNPLHPLRIAGNSTAILATVILFVALARSVTGL